MANGVAESKGTAAGQGLSWATTLRIWYYFSVPRTWLYSLLGYHFGYYLGSGGDLGWRLWVGDLLYGAIGTSATNFINMVMDQREDSVNKPVRTTYIKHVTPRQLMAATWACYALSVAVAALYRDPVFMAWCFVSIFHSHQYSAPPFRFKKHWLTNNTFLSLGSNTVPFVAGWMVTRPAAELPVAPLCVQFLFILLVLISKDVPDIEGDRYAALSTIPLDYGLLHYKLLSFVPMAACAALVLAGLLEARYLVFAGAAAAAMALILLSDRGEGLGPHERRVAHFVKVFTLTQMGDCLLFTLVAPQLATRFGAATAALSFVFIFTSGYLYPSKGSGVDEANPQHGG
eukprot:m51a1_g9888 hypothetical protein (344) ;mRNA; r:39898-41079